MTIKLRRFRSQTQLPESVGTKRLQWTGPASGVLVDSKPVGAVPATECWPVMQREPRSLGRQQENNKTLQRTAGIAKLMMNTKGAR